MFGLTNDFLQSARLNLVFGLLAQAAVALTFVPCDKSKQKRTFLLTVVSASRQILVRLQLQTYRSALVFRYYPRRINGALRNLLSNPYPPAFAVSAAGQFATVYLLVDFYGVGLF